MLEEITVERVGNMILDHLIEFAENEGPISATTLRVIKLKMEILAKDESK